MGASAIIAARDRPRWLANRFVAPQVQTDHAALKLGAGGFRRALFPLSALIVVLAGRALLRKFHPVHLLDLAVPLLGALAIVRLVVFIAAPCVSVQRLVKRFERLISGTVWIGLALYITGLLPDLLASWTRSGFRSASDSISLLTIINGLLAVTVTLLLALWLGRVLEQRLMSATEMDINMRVVLSKALQAGLVVLAFTDRAARCRHRSHGALGLRRRARRGSRLRACRGSRATT